MWLSWLARAKTMKTKHLLVSVVTPVDVDLYAFATGVLLGLFVAVLLGLSVAVLLGLSVAVLLVDVDFFAALCERLRLWERLGLVLRWRLRTAGAVFKYSYVFGVGGLAALSRLDVDGEGFLVFRVTFPPCLW